MSKSHGFGKALWLSLGWIWEILTDPTPFTGPLDSYQQKG